MLSLRCKQKEKGDVMLELKDIKKYYHVGDTTTKALDGVSVAFRRQEFVAILGASGSGDSDIMMTDTINPLKSKFKGFHKIFKQDDLGLSLSSFLLN